MNKVCFVSIDIEEDFGKEGEEGVKNLDKILVILKKYGISASFFITGEILEKYPDKFRGLASRYEIACHGGMSHRFWTTLSEEERRKELNSFQAVYESVFGLGKKPRGFRAPSHLIDKQGIALLCESDFQYDSSVVPHYPFFTHYRGYQGRKPLLPYENEGILEIPCSGLLGGIPLAGTWIRKLPLFCYRLLLAIKKPNFLTLSLHSWDSLNDKTLDKLAGILEILAQYYQFKTGEQIEN